MSLIEELVKKGLLEKTKVSSLKKEIGSSGKKEEEIILEKELVSEESLFKLKSEQLKIPLKDVDPQAVALDVLDLIPEETAKQYSVVALEKKENILIVGMVYPEDLDAREVLKFLSRRGQFKCEVNLIDISTFGKLLKRHQSLKKEVNKALEKLEEETGTKKRRKIKVKDSKKLSEEAPASKVVNVILRYAVEGKASDIHIEPEIEQVRVRFRLMGILHSSIFLPTNLHKAIVSRVKILAKLKLDESRIPQDGRFSAKVKDKLIDFRVSTFPTTLGEKVVIRVLDPVVGLREFEELGMRKENFKIVEKVIQQPYGLILSTGPTGSGKTTTLYAILQILNKEGVNIVTLEDPVEYFMKGINQSQIRPDINYGFSQGLRHILRQDPDIIMVGEIRDEETSFLVTHAALTGHLVLSTLHTTNALGVIPRLTDLGVQPFLLPSTLSLIIAQRLIRRLCDKCKKKVKPDEKTKEFLLKSIATLPQKVKDSLKVPKPLFIWKPAGCRECGHEGFSGRIGLFEILEMTDDLSAAILEDISEKNLKKEAEKQSMTTMRQDGILKILKGETTVTEVLRTTEEK